MVKIIFFTLCTSLRLANPYNFAPGFDLILMLVSKKISVLVWILVRFRTNFGFDIHLYTWSCCNSFWFSLGFVLALFQISENSWQSLEFWFTIHDLLTFQFLITNFSVEDEFDGHWSRSDCISRLLKYLRKRKKLSRCNFEYFFFIKNRWK